jgi:uncharacterized protein YegL
MMAVLASTGINAQTIGILDLPKEDKPADKPIVRQPLTVIFVCDRSGSMEDNQKIDELNDAIATFFNDLSNDANLADNLQIGVVEFASDAKVSRQPSPLGIRARAPKFKAHGGTNMSDALQKAYALAKNVPSDQLKPIVILITDGEPDSQSDTEREAYSLRQDAHFYTLGVTGADLNFLEKIAGSPQQTATLKGTQFQSFFKDMTDALNYHIMSAQENNGSAPKTFSIQNKSGWKIE